MTKAKPQARQKPKTKDYIKALHQLGYENFSMSMLDDSILVDGERLTDVIFSGMYSQLYDLGLIGAERINHAINAEAYKNKFHPVRDYLESLPAWEQGGVDWIGCFASYLTFDDSEHDNMASYGRAVFERFLIGAVNRAYTGKFNPVIVLDGPQGIGKSYLARWLCSGLPKLFKEAPIQPDNKDCRFAMASNWIWEIGELQSTTRRADREALKYFLSMEEVKERLPYGRFPIIKPALANFIGTVNESGSGFLNDPTGSRRFAVLPVADIDWRYTSNIELAGLWGQAVTLSKQTEYIDELNRKIGKQQQQINDTYKTLSTVEEFLWQHYEIDEGGGEHLTSTQIISYLELQGLKGPQRANAMELAEILRGCSEVVRKTTTYKGKQGRYYIGLRQIGPKL